MYGQRRQGQRRGAVSSRIGIYASCCVDSLRARTVEDYEALLLWRIELPSSSTEIEKPIDPPVA